MKRLGTFYSTIQKGLGGFANSQHMKFFIAPNIPERNLANAIRKYGAQYGVHSADVQLLQDQTVFGDCEYGLLLTHNAIIQYNPGLKTSGNYSTIKSKQSIGSKTEVYRYRQSSSNQMRAIKRFPFTLLVGNSESQPQYPIYEAFRKTLQQLAQLPVMLTMRPADEGSAPIE